jgi:hypothetical protein
VAVGALALIAALAHRPPASDSTPSDDRGASLPAERPGSAIARGPTALVTPTEQARQKHKVRDRAVDWVRTNNRWGPGHDLVNYVASHIDRDLDAAEAFQVLLGPGLVKSSKATLLVGRAGVLSVVELGPGLAREVPAAGCRVQNYSAGDDLRRATPRVLLSDLVIKGAGSLFPERPVSGSVAYRIRDRWPGECALRLTYYFGKRRRTALVPHDRLPKDDQGTLPFSFPPLDEPGQVMPGPDAVFVELVTHDAGRTVVESSAAIAAVRVMPPEAARP